MADYRQGDVNFLSVSEEEKQQVRAQGTVLKEGKEVTVALGEKTGHHHTLYGDIPMKMFKFNDKIYLEVLEEVSLKHQEHDHFKVKPDLYEIEIEQEFDYFLKQARAVKD